MNKGPHSVNFKEVGGSDRGLFLNIFFPNSPGGGTENEANLRRSQCLHHYSSQEHHEYKSEELPIELRSSETCCF